MMATITCQTCEDTGWDDLFDSPCGDCGADLSTAQEVADAQAARAASVAARTTVQQADQELADWLATQTWSDFAVSLAKGYARRGEFTVKQRAAAQRMRAKMEARNENLPAAVEFRWTKWGNTDKWAVRGPEGHANTTVTVTKRNGTAEVTLGEAIGGEGDATVYATAPKPEAKPKADRPDGFYVHRDGEEVTVYKVQTAVNGSGNRYAKRLVGDTFEYVGRAPLNLDLEPLTLEVAAQYGHLYGRCMCCGRTLTDEGSIEAGIGPVCASKL